MRNVIALTGGIGSGKSTVAARLRELGAATVDADQLARAAVAPGSSGLAQIVERFGSAVLTPAGALDRAALGELVFSDDGARRDLEAITHPAVRELAEQRFRDLAAERPGTVVVYEIPLLAETRRPGSGAGGAADRDPGVPQWREVVVTEAPAEVRIARLIEHRGLSREQAISRVRSQASDAERRRLATVVIDTGGSLERTLAQVDALWRRLAVD